MKILVAVREIAEVEGDFEIDGTGVDDRYLAYDLNEWDEYAVEEAVQLREAGEDVEVVSVTVGPERAEETVRAALATGVDRAVRVWDDALDQDLLDTAAKVRVLRAVVEEEEPDLILTGVQASDDAFGAAGVALAESLDWGWAAVVNKLDREGVLSEGVAGVHRELEGGVDEVSEVELPAVLTVQTGINELRSPADRDAERARSEEIASKSLADLGLAAADVESSLRLAATSDPESEVDATTFEGDARETAGQLAEVLREKGVGAE